MTTPTLIPLTHLGLLKVSGVDAGSFLQGQLSSDIRALTPVSHQLAAFCNRLGRALALMDIFSLQEQEYFLILPLDILQDIQQQLQKYIVFSKAKIEDMSEDYSGIALLNTPSAGSEALFSFRSTPDAPIQLWGKKTQIADFISTHPCPIGTLNEFILAQMRAHIPLIAKAQTGHFLPHPLGLVKLGVINFKKGCFVGQEIIARMQYRTEVKKQLQYFEMQQAQDLMPQEKIERDGTHGTVVNALQIHDGFYAVLAIMDQTA